MSASQLMTTPWRRWQDWGIVVLGILLLASPWIAWLGVGERTTDLSTWNGSIIGAVIAILGLWALARPGSAIAYWIAILAGAWAFVSPWVLGYANLMVSAWFSWVIGILTLALAAWLAFLMQPGRGATPTTT